MFEIMSWLPWLLQAAQAASIIGGLALLPFVSRRLDPAERQKIDGGYRW